MYSKKNLAVCWVIMWLFSKKRRNSRKKRPSSSWRRVFSRGRSVSLKEYSYGAASKPNDTGMWMPFWTFKIFCTQKTCCIAFCESRILFLIYRGLRMVLCVYSMTAGRSTDSESEVLSEEDYSAKVASEGSLAAVGDKSGEWTLSVKLLMIFHVLWDVVPIPTVFM